MLVSISYFTVFPLDFQNGGRPPSWIWFDVIRDHPRLVFDGPNILLKLLVDRIHTLQDIVILLFGPFGLKLPIHAPFGDVTPKWIPILSQPLGLKHIVWAINHENPSTGSINRRAWELRYNTVQQTNQPTNQLGKSHKTVVFHLSGEKPRWTDWNENLRWCRPART